MVRTFTIALLEAILLQGTLAHAEQAQNDAKAGGYNCLFMGHSFFSPVARDFGKFPPQCGIKNHRQEVVFSGGATGGPNNLWFGPRGDGIRATLKTGKIELLGMTFFSPNNGSFEDYKRWIDFALEHNPDTKFFIGLSWAPQAIKRELKEYDAANERTYQHLLGTVKRLREAYPDTTILYVTYYKAAVELKARFEAGQLPDVDGMVRSGSGSGIFTDNFGHASTILKDLSGLIWTTLIYDVDLTKCDDLKLPYPTDLAEIAMRLARMQTVENVKGKK